MSLKDMIESWKAGVDLGEKEQYEEAIRKFTGMSEPGARIYFNIANMYLRLGKLAEAEDNLNACVKKDPHLAIGFFQRGCLSLLNKKFEKAIADFDMSMKNLRGNLLIDYKQLGLMHKLYSCEILYNRSYALYQLGRKSDALRQLDEALSAAADSSESRHQVIKHGMEQAKSGESFLPYKLPKSATLFVPPRTKTNVVQNMDFLGKAKVVSSIVDQDQFAGFVGAQKRKEREGLDKSPSPSPVPSSARSTSPQPKPTEDPKSKSRPPKPTMAPPPPRASTSTNTRATPSPTRDMEPRSVSVGARSPSPSADSVTVKIHYTSTRAIRVSKSTPLQKLMELVCKKFERSEGSMTIWHRISETDSLIEIESDEMLKHALSDLEDGFRLTVWAYDKSTDDASNGVGNTVTAVSDYKGQFEDELSFNKGDQIEIINTVNDEWYYGALQDGAKGIFPKCCVE